LGDLRVLNGAGEVVPFALRRPAAEAPGTPTMLRLPLFPLRGDSTTAAAALQLRIDAGRTSIEVEGAQPANATQPLSAYLVDSSSIEGAIDSLRFDWAEDAPDFAIDVVLEASDDLVQWRQVVPRAPLARLRHAGAIFEQRTVSFAPGRARFWRLTADRPGALPSITAADATLVSARIPVERLQHEVGGREEPGSAGTYVFDLGAQLPVDRIEFELPDINSVAGVVVFARRNAREEWHLVTGTSVYRLQAAIGELKSAPIGVPAGPMRHWRVQVDQRGGGIGRGMPRLRAGWLPDQVVFVTRGAGPFELVYGSGVARGAEVPLDTLLPSADPALAGLAAPGILARTGAPREAGGADRLQPPAPPGAWRLWILWAALLAGVAALGAVAVNLARQMREGS
jgi:hypothetical protein